MTQLGKYELHETLGKGGFGMVYRAIDTSLGREVALKVLHPQLMVDDTFIERFKKEARVLAALDHPNIVSIYELGEIDGRIFIAMRYLSGGSLQARIQEKGSLSFEDANRIMGQVCEGLQVAHEQGMVHRDLKPANILFDGRGNAVISDFGLAKIVQMSGTSSSLGVVGTPAYRAPELWRGTPPASPATDVYSLGCIFVEMLTGKVLFDGATPDEIITQHLVDGPKLTEELISKVTSKARAFILNVTDKENGKYNKEFLRNPVNLNSNLPLDVERFLKKTMMKNPSDRFSTVSEMENALHKLVGGTPFTFDFDLSVDAKTDQLETRDEDLSMVHWEKNSINQPPIKLPYQDIPQVQTPIYSTQTPAKTKSTSWIILGACAVIGTLVIILLSGNGSSSRVSGLSQSYNESDSSIFQSLGQDSSSFSAQNDYVASNVTKPTITPTIFACPGMPPSRVKVGDKVVVCSKERLILRVDPSKTAADIRRFEPGTKFEIIDGPECADDSTWWKALFKYNDKEYTGWVREGTDPESTYFICVVEE